MLIEMVTHGEDDPTFAAEILKNERQIVWVDDHLKYPYLREMNGLYLEPEHFDPGFCSLKLIGYAIVETSLIQSENSPVYRRRSWWFDEKDPYPEKYAFPLEAVIPRYIRAGQGSPIGKDCGGDEILYIERNKTQNTLMILHPDGSRAKPETAFPET